MGWIVVKLADAALVDKLENRLDHVTLSMASTIEYHLPLILEIKPTSSMDEYG